MFGSGDSKSLGRLRRFEVRNRVGDRFRVVFSTGRMLLGAICSYEHENGIAPIF